MTSDDIFDLIETIAGTSSKKAKEALIASHANHEDFVLTLAKTYNPLITYGIAKRPALTGEQGTGLFAVETWQLLKDLETRALTGNAAIEAVAHELTTLSQKSSELLWRVIGKDMRAGFTDSTTNKAIPGLLPDFPYMRCSLPKHVKMDQLPWAAGLLSQLKADGMFANVTHEAGGNVIISSRQGSMFPIGEFKDLAAAVARDFKPDTQTHGELLVYKDGSVLAREISNGMLNSVLSGGTLDEGCVVHFMAWDQIPLSSVVPKGKYKIAYVRRYADLTSQVAKGVNSPISMIETRVVRSAAEAYAHYREILKRGLEGTIIKTPTAIWVDGTSKEQIKLKLTVPVDLKIVGFISGNGKNAATFGSVTCRTSDDLLEVNVSGMTDKLRDEIHAQREELPGGIMTVMANAIMNPSEDGKLHSLFLPRYVEIRKDKTQADSLQQVKDQFESAVMA